MITRREFLALMAAVGVASPRPGFAAARKGALVGAADRRDGRHGWAIAREGRVVHRELPARGHGVCAHPNDPNLAVLMGRRPAVAGWVLDVAGGRVEHTLEAADGRHFFGHAAFSPDGAHLYTTESLIDTADGLIGVWDSQTWERVAEWTLPGVGPHELVVRSDGRLIVAIGGIETRPESGRTPLNLEHMDPSIVTLDAAGCVRAQARAPDPKLSLRHLGLAADGAVAVAGQYRREASDVDGPVSLLYRLDPRGERLTAYDGSPADWAGFNDYLGSVSVHAGSGCTIVTSPRGGRVGVWGADGRLRATVDMMEVCGLAIRDGVFWVTNSYGQIEALDLDGTVVAQEEAPDLLWDNHLLWLPA